MYVVTVTNNEEKTAEVKLTRVASLRKTLKFGKLKFKNIRATGWILLLGDAIHNFAGINL